MARAKVNHDNLLLFPLHSNGSEVSQEPDPKDFWEVPGPTWEYPDCPPFAEIDFETYYETGYSLEEMSPWEYITHHNFNAHTVSIEICFQRRWFRWVGDPKNAPWSRIAKFDWISHNASFDELVFRRLQHDGTVLNDPEMGKTWYCTADLAAFLQIERNLATSAKLLLGEIADKDVRKRMKTGSASRREILDYAAEDARMCGWIWARCGHKWPIKERYLSMLQRREGWNGIYIDVPKAQLAIQKMRKIQSDTAIQIPWANRYPVTSPKGLKIQCAKEGIECPPSVSLDDKDTEIWNNRNGTKYPWLSIIREFTKARQTESSIQTMLDRTRKDGTAPFELVYRKAPHTARWQSAGKLRLQNLDRNEFNGVSIRHLLIPRPGYKFIAPDLSQIEPRVLNWFAGDTHFLQECARGQSPYEAHARATMGYSDPKPLKKKDPLMYQLAKARTLALGYQAWAPKFCEMARAMCGLVVFEDEKSYSPDLKTFYRASEIKDRIERNDLEGWSILPAAVDAVKQFRDSAPLIVSLWGKAENEIRACVGGDYFVQIPNGSVLRYFNVQQEWNPKKNRFDIHAWVMAGTRNPEHHSNLYGGKLVENLVQRTAREVLADKIYELSQLDGLRFIWSVHDEAICEVPANHAEEYLAEAIRIMSTSPSWAPDLPLACDGTILDHYTK